MASQGRYNAQGSRALYVAEGKGTNAVGTAFEELREGADVPLRLESKHMELDNVLDLTDKDVLGKLGINKDMLTERFGDRIYDTTNAIGDIARQHGFDGIRAPSARNKNGTNLIIFLD